MSSQRASRPRRAWFGVLLVVGLAGVACAARGALDECGNPVPRVREQGSTVWRLDTTLEPNRPGAPGRLLVRVRDAARDRPLERAMVVLLAGPELLRPTQPSQHYTAADGEAVFASVPAGEYVLRVQRLGSETLRAPAVIRAGRADTAEVRLADAHLCLAPVRSPPSE